MTGEPSRDDDWAAAISLRTAAKALQAIEDIEPAAQTDGPLPAVAGYLIECRIGGGGGGVVYRAVRHGSQRPVALKILNRRLGDSPQAKRAWRELDALDQLHLPAIPRLVDYGEHDGRLFFVTEFIEGRPLDTHCQEHRLTREQRVELLARVCDAAHSLHEQGIIHRDLKPSNVLVDTHGQPMLIDLGLASLLSANVMETLTVEGTPIGSPAFMAPEQARGERTSTRSDVYGLGSTAYSVLLGDTPHAMTDVSLHEAIRRVAHDPPREPRELDPRLPKPLAAVLRKAVARQSKDRYASAAEFAADLRRWLRRDPVLAGEMSFARRLGRLAARHPIVATIGACIVIAATMLGGTSGWIWWFTKTPARVRVSGDAQSVDLLSVGDNLLHTWETGGIGLVRMAEIVDRDPDLGGGRVVVMGFRDSFNPAVAKQLCVFDCARPQQPVWSAGSHLNMPTPISRVGPGTFSVSTGIVADIFPESPGDEIVAIHVHRPYSPAAIRIYDLSGRVLYEVWHDGHIFDVLWVEDAGVLVLAAVNSEGNWHHRGHTNVHNYASPIVVFALRPKLDDVRTEWIRCGGGQGTVIPEWYRCLLPPEHADRFPGRLPNLFLMDEGSEIMFRVELDTTLGLWFRLDLEGNYIETIVRDIYRLQQADLPDPMEFTFGELPPLIRSPLDEDPGAEVGSPNPGGV